MKEHCVPDVARCVHSGGALYPLLETPTAELSISLWQVHPTGDSRWTLVTSADPQVVLTFVGATSHSPPPQLDWSVSVQGPFWPLGYFHCQVHQFSISIPKFRISGTVYLSVMKTKIKVQSCLWLFSTSPGF